MSSTAWGVIGAIVCLGGYQLLKYWFGGVAGYVFAGLVVAAYIVSHLVYQHRLRRLRDEFARLPEEDRVRVLDEIDPEIAKDLKKPDTNKGDQI